MKKNKCADCKDTFDADSHINYLLTDWSNGNQQAETKLLEVLHPYIHDIAHRQFKSKGGCALQTTEIVNEAYIKLRQQKSLIWQNKQHFLAVAAKVIRHVIVDHFRSEKRKKRGGIKVHLTLERLEEMIQTPSASEFDWIAVDHLLHELEAIDPQAAQVAEYKVFGGLTIPQMAAALSVSESTVSRNWKFARLWLLSQLK